MYHIDIPTKQALLDAHNTKNFQALNAIHSTIDEENFEIIAHFRLAREAYLRLCTHHGDTGGLSTSTLFYDLVNLRLQPGGLIAENVHKF